MSDFPLLSLILFTPLVGAIVLLFVNGQRTNLIRWIANIFAIAGFLVSLPLWFQYDTQNPAFQFVERHEWIPSIGAEYFLAVDGFSSLMILLATLMGVIAVLSSWTAITERLKEFYIFMLTLQVGMLGAFMALDFLLFFVFWEVMLVPMYFLIGIWGSDRRLYSAIKFFLFTLVGSVVMLLGILAVYFYNESVTGVYTFDVTQFHNLSIPPNTQWWIFLAFFLGFAVKVPMFPFHTWLPDAHTDAPTAASVILAAVLLKMGTYGFIRFSLPILPEATRTFVPMIVALSIIGIVYGALVAMAQSDWKRLVAYSSVSHMGMVMLGMFALTPVGITGSIVQQLNHGISTGALFLIVGIVYERRHTREISEYGGLSKIMPVYARRVPHHDDVINWAADAERLHRRGTDPARRLRRQQAVGGVCRERHRVGRGLYALALPTHHVRHGDQPEERGPGRPHNARGGYLRPAPDPGVLDRPVSRSFPAPLGDIGRLRHDARQRRLHPPDGSDDLPRWLQRTRCGGSDGLGRRPQRLTVPDGRV